MNALVHKLALRREPVLYLVGLVVALYLTARGLDGDDVLALLTQNVEAVIAVATGALALRQSVYAPETAEVPQDVHVHDDE